MENVTLHSTENISSLDCFPCIDTVQFIPILSVYFLFSFPANGWTVWLMTSSPVFLTDRMEVFEFSLVLCELLYCLVLPVVPPGLHFFRVVTDRLMLPLTGLTFVVRPILQSCLCLERYVAVVHPMVFLRYKPLRYRLLCCSLVWVATTQTLTAAWFMCLRNNLVFVPICISMFCFVFLVNSFACLSVLRALTRSGPGEGNKERAGASNRQKRKAFRYVAIIQVTMVLSYVPFVVTSCLFGHIAEEVFCQIHLFTIVTALWNGLLHPGLYLHRARKLPWQRPRTA